MHLTMTQSRPLVARGMTTANLDSALIPLERLAPAERPRERLRALGVRSVGAAELVAVILAGGRFVAYTGGATGRVAE
jgi:hypothetical protein